MAVHSLISVKSISVNSLEYAEIRFSLLVLLCDFISAAPISKIKWLKWLIWIWDRVRYLFCEEKFLFHQNIFGVLMSIQNYFLLSKNTVKRSQIQLHFIDMFA